MFKVLTSFKGSILVKLKIKWGRRGIAFNCERDGCGFDPFYYSIKRTHVGKFTRPRVTPQ